MRAILSARYSSENQREASIADQLRVCREYVVRQGWTTVAEYSDAAISGASMHRPGIQAAVKAALSGQAEVLLAEALDRFSRDQEHTARLFKELTFSGVQLVTVSEGVIGHLHVGLKGTMNALYLQDLADKTRRGLRGRVEAGKSGGGRCYGYRVSAIGERSIHELEAAIVVRIFSEYVAGVSPKIIGQRLNREGIMGPHGWPWGPTTIHGHAKRGTGLLNNELYVGRLVWNRQRYLKNPHTGRRVSRPNPVSEWIGVELPDLRIVPSELWEAAKRRQDETRYVVGAGALWRARRHQYLFSGLLHCAECGYGYASYVRERLACTGARERGVCRNRRTIRRDEVEHRVLAAIEQRALGGPLFDVFCEEVRSAVAEYTREHRTRSAATSRERTALDREIAHLVQFIKDGVAGPAVRAELQAPRWTVQMQQLIDGQNQRFRRAAETGEFYFVPSSGRKSVWTLVRQLRGPHLSTCA